MWPLRNLEFPSDGPQFCLWWGPSLVPLSPRVLSSLSCANCEWRAVAAWGPGLQVKSQELLKRILRSISDAYLGCHIEGVKASPFTNHWGGNQRLHMSGCQSCKDSERDKVVHFISTQAALCSPCCSCHKGKTAVRAFWRLPGPGWNRISLKLSRAWKGAQAGAWGRASECVHC